MDTDNIATSPIAGGPQMTQIPSQTEMSFPPSTLTLFSPYLSDSEARPKGHAYRTASKSL
jgi:hypothetical protein